MLTRAKQHGLHCHLQAQWSPTGFRLEGNVCTGVGSGQKAQYIIDTKVRTPLELAPESGAAIRFSFFLFCLLHSRFQVRDAKKEQDATTNSAVGHTPNTHECTNWKMEEHYHKHNTSSQSTPTCVKLRRLMPLLLLAPSLQPSTLML